VRCGLAQAGADEAVVLEHGNGLEICSSGAAERVISRTIVAAREPLKSTD
jgi:hypothetical protein